MSIMHRASGLSVRLKLTLSYAGFVMVAGALLLGAVWVFLLRYVPRGETILVHGSHTFFSPGRGVLLRDFGPAAAIVLACLLVFGLLGGWLLAGRMLNPLARITEAPRMAASGSLSHRIRLPGRDDEFRELADAFDAMLAQLEAHVRGAAEVCGQCLPRTAHPARDHADASGSCSKRSESRQRRTGEPSPLCEHPRHRPH